MLKWILIIVFFELVLIWRVNADDKCLMVPDTLRPGEPDYCTYDGLMKHLITPGSSVQGHEALFDPKLIRSYAFDIEGNIVVGLAVGASSDNENRTGGAAVEKIYASMCDPMPERLEIEKPENCTWHFNNQSTTAARLFHHKPLPDPHDPRNANAISEIIQAQFADWNQCLSKSKCLIMGCHGQKHRGPTAFMDFLVTKNCSSEHAEDIVCRIWGMNGIAHSTRLQVARNAEKYLKKNGGALALVKRAPSQR